MATKEQRTPSLAGREMRPHIGIYGRCNVGKSSLLNLLTGAQNAIVSPHSGTTTDIVRKACEILDFAPVVFLDTAGVDDPSEGIARVEATQRSFHEVDMAIILYRCWGETEEALSIEFKKLAVPCAFVRNLWNDEQPDGVQSDAVELNVEHPNLDDRDRIFEQIKMLLPEKSYRPQPMFEAGRIASGDVVVLVCPIDSSAPAGRLILPQVQVMRELLDKGAIAVAVQPDEIEKALSQGIVPRIVVTDSQVLARVRSIIPMEIEVTSFSALLAAAKGDVVQYRAGLDAVGRLRDGDKILISESCTHQVSCEDIGRVKIPRWLEQYTGHKFSFDVISGREPLPANIAEYALIVQCGACMVTRSQLHGRLREAKANGVPITNYGMLIQKLTVK